MSARRLAPLAIVLVAAVFFAPELVGGRVAMTSSLARWRPWSEAATRAERTAPSHNPDCATSYYPRRHVLHESIREGELPFWNPDTFCGAPFLADPQAEVLYPPALALSRLDPRAQLGWFLFLHVAWGGLGAYVLLRRHGTGVAVAAAAASAFALNGWFAKHFGQPPFLAAAAWLPWILVAAEGVRHAPTPRRAAVLGLVGALAFLAGQPQITFQAVYASLLVVGVGLAVRPVEGASLRPRSLVAAAAFAAGVALLLVAPQLLPTLDLAGGSARTALPYQTVISGAFHPADAIRFVVPEFFGSPLTLDEWSPLFSRGDGFYLRTQINSVFAGAPVFVLALIGMLGARTRRAAFPFTVLLIVAALVAFASPLAQVIYHLPGFRFSRIDRLGNLIVLAQIVPAALAASQLANPGGAKRRALGIGIVVAALAGALAVTASGGGVAAALGADVSRLPGGLLPHDAAAHVLARTWVAAAFVAATGAVLILPARRWVPVLPFVLAVIQLFLFASPYRGDRRRDEVFPPNPPGLEALRDALARTDEPGEGGTRFVRFGRDLPVRPYPLSSVFPPSTNVVHGLRDLQGYNALADRRLGETLEVATGESLFSHGIWAGRRIVAPLRSTSLEHPLFDALSVGAAVGAGGLTASGWTALETDGFRLWRNVEALPRVRLTPAGRGVSPEEMDRVIRAADLDPRREVLWIGAGVHGGPGEGPPGTVRIEREGRNGLAVRVELAREAVLVVADSHAPGWVARVNGEEAEILPAWGLVRALRLPAGAHRVEMDYTPPGFRLGLLLAALGALAAGLGLGWRFRD